MTCHAKAAERLVAKLDAQGCLRHQHVHMPPETTHQRGQINQQLCVGLKEIYNDTFSKGQACLLFTAQLVFITFTSAFTCISLHLLANSVFIYMVPVPAEV